MTTPQFPVSSRPFAPDRDFHVPHADQQVWALYQDWCTATDREPTQSTMEDVTAFLQSVPTAESTQRARVKVLRRVLAKTEQPLVTPRAEVASAWRTGDHWPTLSEALAYAPHSGWPAGFRGRRDAWLLVLIHSGLTRAQATEVSAADVDLTPGHIAVNGALLEPAANPHECPACAVVRWLDILGVADRWGKSAARNHLHDQPLRTHPCRDRLSHSHWTNVWHLLPAIDRYGWVADWRPMSLRAISAVIAYRQAAPALCVPPARDDSADHNDSLTAPLPTPMAQPLNTRTLSKEEETQEMDALLGVVDERIAAADEMLRRVETQIAEFDARQQEQMKHTRIAHGLT